MMTVLQKLQVRQSEVRESINSLLGNDARTEEQQGELETLTGEGQRIETEIRAAIVATPDPDEVVTATGNSESRERIELRAKTGLADFLKAAAGGTSVSGAAAEYCDSLSIPTVGHLPMALFGRTTTTNPHLHFPTVETRAITPGPAVDGPLQPTIPFVFEKSAAISLGIMMPSVPMGQVQIDVRNGQVSLTPCGAWSVSGSDDPGSWKYIATMTGPTATRTVTIPAASVLHVRYSPDPARPWIGRSPMSMALSTARVAGLLEHATGEELNFVQKQLLTPRRGAGDYALTDTLSPDTIEKIVSAVAEHVGTGAFVIPADVTPQRLGPEPPDTFPLLRDRLENSILSLHGIPPALVQPGGTGTGAREAFRQVLHGLVRPLGALLAEELQAKLHPDAALDFTSMRAGDIVGTSRALGSLTQAGLTVESAATIVGLDGAVVKEVSA